MGGWEGYFCGMSRARCEQCRKTWCSKTSQTQMVMKKYVHHGPLRGTGSRTSLLSAVFPTVLLVLLVMPFVVVGRWLKAHPQQRNLTFFAGVRLLDQYEQLPAHAGAGAAPAPMEPEAEVEGALCVE